MTEKIMLRKKGKFADGSTKYILEKTQGKKILETRTVMRPDKLWELHRPGVNGTKPSRNDAGPSENKREKFAQELLTEPAKKDVTEEDAAKLWEMTR